MRTTQFSIRILAIAVAAALAQSAGAGVFAGDSYDQNGAQAFDQFTITDSDQTTQAAVLLTDNSSLTVNQTLTLSSERTTSANYDLVGIFVESETAALDTKGIVDISVVNNSNMLDKGIVGLSTYGAVKLEGENNHIQVCNKSGNNYLNGIALMGGGNSLEAQSFIIDVINEVPMPSDKYYANNAHGFWQQGGTLKVQDLTVNVTGKGSMNNGISGVGGTAEIGNLKIKVTADGPESEEVGPASAYGLWIVPDGSSPSDYSLQANTIDIEASSVQGGDAYGVYVEKMDDESPKTINVSALQTDIRIAKAGSAYGVNLLGLEEQPEYVKADLGTVMMNVQGDEATGIDAWGATVVVDGLAGEIRAANDQAQGIYSDSSVLTANGNVSLTVAGESADGLELRFGSRATFNGTVDLKVTSASDNAQGIVLDQGSTATFNEHVTVAVSTTADGEEEPNQLYGVDVGSEEGQAEFLKGLTVTTSGTAKNVYHVALNADEGKIVVKGGAVVDAEDGYWALKTADGGSITIEEDPESISTINGNIWSKGPDSIINVALDGGDSLSARSALQNGGAFNLGLKDGAVWNVGAGGASAATTVASDAGHLAFTDVESSLTVETLSLADTTVVSMSDVPANGGHYITADNITGDGIVRAEGSGDMNDARTESVSEVVDSMANAVFGEAAQDKVGEVYLAEGKLFGEVEAVLNENGTYEIAERTNTKLEAASTLAVLSAMQWRHEMNDLTKRMGELRTSPEGIGSWVRLYGSEQAYGGIEVKNASVQVGADVDVGAGWKVGAAFNYTDGTADIANGSADSKAYGIAAYGTWMDANGQFVDLIAKYSKLDTDYEVKGVDGSFDNNAWSVSAEYGWHFKLAEAAFVEPQAELTYGQVIGDDAVNGEGVRLEQEDFESLIGRVGVRAGFFFPDNKGVVYARASVLHDFKGEAETVAKLNGQSVTLKDDLGGTWGELGIGANFNLTDMTYTYVDLEKTTGGDVSEKWRWNVGLRHVF